MIQQHRCVGQNRRRGFSMMELIIASVLMAMLGVLLAQALVTFGRPALEVESRARITQEAILATQSLACDLGGFLADSLGRTGTYQYQAGSPSPYQFIGWDFSQGNVLLLNFQGASSGNPIVISYELPLTGNQLLRLDSSTGVTTSIANHVTGFTVEQDPGNASNVQIDIAFTYRYFSSTYTLIGVPPS